ncbi:hypothetical protein [Streptomyces sp. NPDC050149]|uniref:SCO4402 family protein n=1 Tax=unclassified Streptomyces TaxID=2593676 RepID=UPI0037955638
MPSENQGLRTPWLRSELLEWLVRLSDQDWQEEYWAHGAPASAGFDVALDFFDDSGVLAEPNGRVGYILVDEGEVILMNVLKSALDSSISSSLSSDEEIIHSRAWSDVVAAAREALRVMGGPSGQ